MTEQAQIDSSSHSHSHLHYAKYLTFYDMIPVNEKAEELLNSLSGFKEFRREGQAKENYFSKVRYYLEQILLNINLNSSIWYIFSATKSSYYQVEQLCHISYDAFMDTIRALESSGFIEVWTGHEQAGLSSRFKATDRLIALAIVRPFPEYNSAYVQIKDENKNPIEPTTLETSEKYVNLKNINTSLSQHVITVNLSESDIDDIRAKDIRSSSSEKRNFTDTYFSGKKLYRSFNEGQYDRGGRYYGGFWQTIPKEYRRYILIDGIKTVELDFKGLHPTILYLRKGMNPPQEIYPELGGYSREWVKKAFLILLNTLEKRQAISSFLYNYNQHHYQSTINGRQAKELFDSLEENHSEIREFFYTNISLELQFIDSRIATIVQTKVIDELNTICLPVHDSFIIQYQRENELKAIMMSALKQQLELDSLELDLITRQEGVQRDINAHNWTTSQGGYRNELLFTNYIRIKEGMEPLVDVGSSLGYGNALSEAYYPIAQDSSTYQRMRDDPDSLYRYYTFDGRLPITLTSEEYHSRMTS